jgi:hypothetical protein
VAVEAALILPLLLAMLFGIVDLSFMIRDDIALTSATREGSRVAAAEADAGPGTCETGLGAPPCAPANTPALAQDAADAVQSSGSALPKGEIDYILIYKANDKGYPGATGSTTMPTVCPANCVKFVWRDTAGKFRYDSGTWVSTTINACANDPLADTLGIYLHATHKFVTGIIGSSTSLDDRTIMKFEPLPVESCKSTSPVPHP